MSNMGLLEVYVKRVKSVSDSESDYETAVDMSHSYWTDTKYKLKVNVYDGFIIEINTTNMITHYTEIWPEDNFATHTSKRDPEHSNYINAHVYDNHNYHLLKVNDNCLRAIVDAVNARESRTVMIPFPQAEMERLFNIAFKTYLNKRLNDWRQEAA